MQKVPIPWISCRFRFVHTRLLLVVHPFIDLDQWPPCLGVTAALDRDARQGKRPGYASRRALDQGGNSPDFSSRAPRNVTKLSNAIPNATSRIQNGKRGSISYNSRSLDEISAFRAAIDPFGLRGRKGFPPPLSSSLWASQCSLRKTLVHHATLVQSVLHSSATSLCRAWHFALDG